jgi:hypothetical protein
MLTAHVHHVQQQWGANGFKYVFFLPTGGFNFSASTIQTG